MELAVGACNACARPTGLGNAAVSGDTEIMSSAARTVLTLAVFVATLALVIVKPRGRSEAVWTVAGAATLLALGICTPRDVVDVTLAGRGALLFLLALLVLSALVEASGFFEWAAIHAARRAGGDGRALYRNVFWLGSVVTFALSLDTTAVMLTPIVLAFVARLGLPPRPYVIACAFVANTASLLLPISNLTNLLFVEAFHLGFAPFAARMALPQFVALVATYALCRLRFRAELPPRFDPAALPAPASAVVDGGYFRAASVVLVLVLAGYFLAPRLRVEPYVVAFAGAAVLVGYGVSSGCVGLRVLRDVPWDVFPFVIGLFVVVRGVEHLGLVDAVAGWLERHADAPFTSLAVGGVGTAVAANVMNNLPAALLARGVIAGAHAGEPIVYGALPRREHRARRRALRLAGDDARARRRPEEGATGPRRGGAEGGDLDDPDRAALGDRGAGAELRLLALTARCGRPVRAPLEASPACAGDDARGGGGDPRRGAGGAGKEARLPRLRGEEQADSGGGREDAAAEEDGGDQREVAGLGGVGVAGEVARAGGAAVGADVVLRDERTDAEDAAQGEGDDADACQRDSAGEAKRAGLVEQGGWGRRRRAQGSGRRRVREGRGCKRGDQGERDRVKEGEGRRGRRAQGASSGCRVGVCRGAPPSAVAGAAHAPSATSVSSVAGEGVHAEAEHFVTSAPGERQQGDEEYGEGVARAHRGGGSLPSHAGEDDFRADRGTGGEGAERG